MSNDYQSISQLNTEKRQADIGINLSDPKTADREIVSAWRLSRILGEDWNRADVLDLMTQVGVFEEVPLSCKGNACSFASRCPVVTAGYVDKYLGKPCPEEQLHALKHLTGYLYNLRVPPSDYATIQVVNDLVRMLIQMRRCDLLLRNEDPVETMLVDTKASTKGGPPVGRKVSELLNAQVKLRADIERAYKNLMASREARLRESQITKGHIDSANMITDLLQNYTPNKSAETEEGI